MTNEKRFFSSEEIMDELYDRTVHGSPVGMQFANAFAEFLKELTPIDGVEVVHSSWKYYHKQNIAVCTNCSFERDLDENFGRAISCPNCGAKMDGGKNGK